MKKIKNAMMVVAGGMVMLFAIVSCEDEETGLPPIDGYNNSNEVAATNLKAHWTFDNTQAEAISSTAPGATFGTVGYTPGQIGTALNLTRGALVYPPIANINTADALSNYTVSMWVKVNNTGNTFTTFFGIVPSALTDLWGAIDMSAETGWFQPTSGEDTLVLKTNYGSLKLDGSIDGQDNRPDPRGNPPVGVFKGTNRWVHFVARWDATAHTLEVFGDGVSIGAYNNRGTAGPLVLKTPAQAIVGSLPHNDIGFTGITGTRGDWMPWATAAVDDIRVFNTALAPKDITALYNLGKAGR